MRLPYPHPGQIRVRREARRFNWLMAGRRWRKTTLAMSISVEAATTAAQQGHTVIWGAPTYQQVRIGMDETRRAVVGVASFNMARMEARFPGGGWILYRSLDNPDNARGYTAHGVVLDEVADVAPAAWYEVLRPMLIDTNGWMWAIGTPKGNNWLYSEYLAAQERSDSMAWQAPTLGVEITGAGLKRVKHPLENPDIPFVEIEQLYRALPERVFRQEILAEFVADGAGVIRFVREAMQPQVRAPVAGHTYVAGLDWALTTDYTVLSIVDAGTGANVWNDRFNGIDYRMQRERIAALCRQWGVAVIEAEANAMGKPNNDELRRMGLPVRDFVTTNATKAELIERLASAFENRRITIPDGDSVLAGELESLEATRLPSGSVRYAASEGRHDDMAIALALAWHGASRPAASGLVDFAV